MQKPPRILLAASDEFVRRLVPSLAAFAHAGIEFCILDPHRTWPALRKIIRTMQPAAIITEWRPQITARIHGLGFPMVVVDTDRIFSGAVSIDVDDWKVGENAARFFLEAGYRHFGFISLPEPYARQREEGFRRYLSARGHVCKTLRQLSSGNHHYMESWGQADARLASWLARQPRPLALLAAHDPLGQIICETARSIGLHVPDEIAVIGVNDDPLVCALSSPPLSSVAIPWNNLAHLAGEWASALMAGKKAPTKPVLIAPGPVIVRQSTTLLAMADVDLRRCLQYLRANFRKAITVGIMCLELRISRRLVERKFALYLAVSPWKYLCRLRLQAAQELMARTDLLFSEIADRTGFSNAERFSVIFRREVGLSPSKYRAQAQGEIRPDPNATARS